ncbi:hypothetical protein [Candidatus Borrarchaeum sp.]|uniref:hypothetical protein n=1 Tax=Candidatus Borrarchaeum sp. TaxID=2846742 RepID=UPI00257A9063|nr:hypothetical protein [Candidatus Borrarchaeum sp.]
MNKKHRMIATGFLCFCLLFMAANTAVMAQDDYWGDLVVGDKMIWEVSGILNGVQVDADLEIRVLEITGKLLTINMSTSGLAGGFYGFSEEEHKIVYEDEISPWILPASKLKGQGTTDYEWKGNTYEAVYGYSSDSNGHVEVWVEKSCGILFELDFESNSDNIDATARLDYTNATLKTKGCLGTIFIALFTVAGLVSYSTIKLKKKE